MNRGRMFSSRGQSLALLGRHAEADVAFARACPVLRRAGTAREGHRAGHGLSGDECARPRCPGRRHSPVQLLLSFGARLRTQGLPDELAQTSLRRRGVPEPFAFGLPAGMGHGIIMP